MYCILEFDPKKPGENRRIELALSSWVSDGEFKHPTNKMYTKALKNKTSPLLNWKKSKYTNILKSNIETFEEAQVAIKTYENHEDSQSELEATKRKLLKKKHPVNSKTDDENYQLKFDKLKEKVND
jgi:hypothetical protein